METFFYSFNYFLYIYVKKKRWLQIFKRQVESIAREKNLNYLNIKQNSKLNNK